MAVKKLELKSRVTFEGYTYQPGVYLATNHAAVDLGDGKFGVQGGVENADGVVSEYTASRLLHNWPEEVFEFGVEANKAEAEASDGARKLAAEVGLSLSDIEGTGAGGRIVKADVERHLIDKGG
jgi:pyruvate/2-oxoglutarate dehydrogenase complex dihydrolipoamide acyltransferase (E2) component